MRKPVQLGESRVRFLGLAQGFPFSHFHYYFLFKVETIFCEGFVSIMIKTLKEIPGGEVTGQYVHFFDNITYQRAIGTS